MPLDRNQPWICPSFKVSGWARRAHGCACNDPTTNCRTRPSGQLLGRHPQPEHGAVALDLNGDRSPDDLADHQPLEVADTFDRSAVDLDDQIARPNAGRGGGAAVEELDDLETAPPTEPLGQGRSQWSCSADDPQECPPDATVAHQGGDDRLCRRVDRD